jgi:hypothetical protein
MSARPLLTILAVLLGVVATERWAAGETAAQPLDPPRVRLTDEWARPSRTHGVHLGVEAMTDFPALVGGQLTLEIPHGLRVTAAAGALIRPYVTVINDAVVSLGGYDQRTADIVSDTLGNSFVWNVHVAWRPFGRAGFYLAGGYRQATLGGAVDPVEVVELATGQTPPDAVRAILESSYRVTSTLHMVDVEIGWELVFVRHLTLRFALGAALTVAAHTEMQQVNVDVPAQYEPYVSQGTVDAAISEARQTAADYLDSVYEKYVFTPTFSIGLGYRFF